jgi:hypothetical protein
MFDGPAAKKLWSELGIQKVTTAPHHQSSNGTTERSVSILKNRLRTLGSSMTEWDLLLFEAITAINHSEKLNVGGSSYEIRFHQLPRGSFNPHEPVSRPSSSKFDLDEEIRLKKATIADMAEKITSKYQPGDLVKVRNDNPKHFTSPVWKGPFMVISCSPHQLTVVSPKFQIVQTHVDKIAPFHKPPGYIFGAFSTETLPSTPSSAPARTYEVEDIIGHRFENGKILYLTKWVGYPVSESTYEPPEHFSKISLINAYNKKNGLTNPF